MPYFATFHNVLSCFAHLAVVPTAVIVDGSMPDEETSFLKENISYGKNNTPLFEVCPLVMNHSVFSKQYESTGNAMKH